MPPTPISALAKTELKTWLEKHPLWRIEGQMLVRSFAAPTFLEGIEFVNQIARLAEAADHHPDIDIRWRTVTLRFVTHDAGNQITDKDVKLAQECDLVFATLT